MFLRCHCEEGVSLTWQSSGCVRASPASSGHPMSRPRLDCHVSSLRDLPRNDNECVEIANATPWLPMTALGGRIRKPAHPTPPISRPTFVIRHVFALSLRGRR
ncbi:MAG: hypothetical protein H8E24_08065 [Verrucomicrobia bacterium]|nr:hypothetical protein [Verrucomicrobiota bacterium]